MEIRWTERSDNKGPLFGTFINNTKVEDNFPFEHQVNEYKYKDIVRQDSNGD